MLSTAHVGGVHYDDVRTRSRRTGQTVTTTMRKEVVYMPGFMVLEEVADGEMGDGGTLVEFSSSIVVGIAGARINLHDYRCDN